MHSAPSTATRVGVGPSVPEPVLVMATTYEPGAEQAAGLAAMLADSRSPVLVVDNSTSSAARDLVRRACRPYGLEVAGDGCNRGTAGALNAGLRRARSLGVPWLLYFDQDSRVVEGFWERAVGGVAAVGPDAALVGSRMVHVGSAEAASPATQGLVPTVSVIASGTLFRVADLLAVGGFDERLGLDLVDHEVCLRLRGAGRALLTDPGRHIVHEIGLGSRPTGLRGTRVTRHPRWRRRMMWRNSLLLCRRHARRQPLACLRHLAGRLWETFAGTVVFQDPGLLLAAACGVVDGLRSDTTVVGVDAGEGDPGRVRLP